MRELLAKGIVPISEMMKNGEVDPKTHFGGPLSRHSQVSPQLHLLSAQSALTSGGTVFRASALRHTHRMASLSMASGTMSVKIRCGMRTLTLLRLGRRSVRILCFGITVDDPFQFLG